MHIFTKNRGVKKHPALKGVSFKIYPGESVGIIGKTVRENQPF